MTILEKILKEKEKEVAELKHSFDANVVKREEDIRSFYEKCQHARDIQVIAEFKRSSPSKGQINHGINPDVQAKLYEKAGASMMSILTDEPFFKGSMKDLAAVRKAVDLPLLNKDFIIDPIQIDRAYAYGADVILLIVAALSDAKLKELYEYATSLGLDVLVEVHNQEELERTKRIQPKLIGINNRNLKTFEVTLETTEKLAKQVDLTEQILVSESGIASALDVQRVKRAGAKAILVGETLMKAKNVEETIASFKKGEPVDAN